jgi:hypothetical protein
MLLAYEHWLVFSFGYFIWYFMQVERENSNQERYLGPPYDSKQSPSKDKAAAVNGTCKSSSDTHQEAIISTSCAVKEDCVAVPSVRIQGPPKLNAPSTPRIPTPVAPVQVSTHLFQFSPLYSPAVLNRTYLDFLCIYNIKTTPMTRIVSQLGCVSLFKFNDDLFGADICAVHCLINLAFPAIIS